MIIHADAQALPLADGVAQCCVTSPPYWGLRDYQIPPSVWPASDCAHEWAAAAGRLGGSGGNGAASAKQTTSRGSYHNGTTGAFCARCGAWRGQLGREPTPELYVEHLVGIFREVRRVLRDDGVLWLNLGDSYAAFNGNTATGLKPKDLVGIPWRAAFALQADGWYLRADVIWSKPNPMPESVRDRPTKAHEYVFLLSKRERYFWDADAVKETQATTPHAPGNVADNGRLTASMGHLEAGRVWVNGKRNIRSVWPIATQPYSGAHFATMPEALAARCIRAATRTGDLVLDPFHGSGTVGRVAESLGRRWVGVDLGYHDLAKDRVRVTRGLPFEAHSAGA